MNGIFSFSWGKGQRCQDSPGILTWMSGLWGFIGIGSDCVGEENEYKNQAAQILMQALLPTLW